jgi:hypothetical protein
VASLSSNVICKDLLLPLCRFGFAGPPPGSYFGRPAAYAGGNAPSTSTPTAPRQEDVERGRWTRTNLTLLGRAAPGRVGSPVSRTQVHKLMCLFMLYL